MEAELPAQSERHELRSWLEKSYEFYLKLLGAGAHQGENQALGIHAGGIFITDY